MKVISFFFFRFRKVRVHFDVVTEKVLKEFGFFRFYIKDWEQQWATLAAWTKKGYQVLSSQSNSAPVLLRFFDWFEESRESLVTMLELTLGSLF